MFLYSDNFVTYKKKNTKYAVDFDFHSHRKKAWQAAWKMDAKRNVHNTSRRTGPGQTELN